MKNTWDEINKDLDSWTKEQLKDKIINDHYNKICLSCCDKEGNEHGKALPYIGWFWRYVNFTGTIDIGDCGHFKGVMVNNKWDYPEREMTEEEKKHFIKLVDDINNIPYIPRGDLIQTEIDRRTKIIWDWFQTLTIEENK